MKKTALLLIFTLTIFQIISAQVDKIHVSRHEGEKNVFSFGKLTYNYYRLTTNSELGDTLICSGSGFETCKIDKSIIKENNVNAESYKIFNKAIKSTAHYIKKNRMSSGDITFKTRNRKVFVTFKNANNSGEADFDIQIL